MRKDSRPLFVVPDSRTARNEAMARAYLTHGYTLTEIGQAAGLHYATISRIITVMEKTSQCKM